MKALILDNKVVDVVSTEFEVHSSLTWVDCDDTVKSGYDYKDGKFTDPRALTDEQKAALDAVHYIRQRTGKEGTDGVYASIGDQLDMLYKDVLAGKVDSTGACATHIASVKAKYPKP